MRKIRRRCKCGCKEITNPGRMYIQHHHRRGKKLSAETKLNMSLAKQNMSDETKKKMSEAKKGKKQTAEAILNRSLAKNKR